MTGSKVKSAVKLSLVSGLGVIIGLLLLEGALRVIPQPRPQSNRERPKVYYIPQYANSMRGNVYDPGKKKENEIRVAVVGDSFTFAPKMQFFDSFPYKLELLLNLGAKTPRVHVLNFGTPGTSTFDQIELVKKAVTAQADLIILEITLNDAQSIHLNKTPKEFTDITGGELNQIFGWSKLYRTILAKLSVILSKQKYIDYHHRLFEDPEGFGKFKNSLGEIKKIAEQNSVRLLAVIYPLLDFPVDENYPFADLHALIGGELGALKIPTLDLAPAFRGVTPTRVQLIPGQDSHPNEIASRLAGEAIYEWIRSMHLLDDGYFTTRRYKHRDGVFEASRS